MTDCFHHIEKHFKRIKLLYIYLIFSDISFSSLVLIQISNIFEKKLASRSKSKRLKTKSSAGRIRFRIAPKNWVRNRFSCFHWIFSFRHILSMNYNVFYRKFNEWIVSEKFPERWWTEMSFLNRSHWYRYVQYTAKNCLSNRKEFYLILKTTSGKTSFALSLPGAPNHYRGYWSSDQWYDDADYMILDHIPWDEYQQRGFPNLQDLITNQKFLSVSS